MPGSLGVAPANPHNAELLTSAGMAACVIDLFGKRGVTSTVANQAQYSFAASAWDLVATLLQLAARGEVDPARIGAQGHSRGGRELAHLRGRSPQLPRFAAAVLRSADLAGNRVVDFIAPGPFSVAEVERKLSDASGLSIRATPRFPTYYLYRSLPLFHLRGHRLSSVIPLIRYFDRYGYTDEGPDAGAEFPDLRMTMLDEYPEGLWSAGGRSP